MIGAPDDVEANRPHARDIEEAQLCGVLTFHRIVDPYGCDDAGLGRTDQCLHGVDLLVDGAPVRLEAVKVARIGHIAPQGVGRLDAVHE